MKTQKPITKKDGISTTCNSGRKTYMAILQRSRKLKQFIWQGLLTYPTVVKGKLLSLRVLLEK
jgi:hypothetical protein